MMILKKILFIFLLIEGTVFSQSLSNSCKLITNEKEVFIVDSVQFSVYYCSNINLENKDCFELIAEGYSNEVPREGVNRLCVLFVESKTTLKNMNWMGLFDNEGDYENREKVKLIFVYDANSGFTRPYYGENELKTAYKLNLRSGISKK